MLEIAEQVLKIGIKYGPVVYRAGKAWVESLIADPVTPADEIAGLKDLLVRADTWEKRVKDAPDIPRRPE